MEIDGKVHCFFEQSGTFKNEFKKLGYEAYDYDIQNNFGQTDFVVDLFAEIEKGFDGKPSLFDKFGGDDLIMAFFPCIHFCDAKTMMFKGVHTSQKNRPLWRMMDSNIELSKQRQKYFELLMKLVSICSKRHIRLIIENPWNTSGDTFLQNNFIEPSIIDKDRSLRGDVFKKRTAYWFIECEPTTLFTCQQDKHIKIVYKEKDDKPTKSGICSTARSMIHPDYARNFICDFVIGRRQNIGQLSIFFNYK